MAKKVKSTTAGKGELRFPYDSHKALISQVLVNQYSNTGKLEKQREREKLGKK
jgi:hypothetical protein